jgi:alcohol dehydrogenase
MKVSPSAGATRTNGDVCNRRQTRTTVYLVRHGETAWTISGQHAGRFRSDATQVVNNDDGKAVEKVMTLTADRGVDVAIEAIGIPASFDICQAIVTAGGHIANIDVHGKPVQLNLDKLWSHNITLTTGLVDTVTTPMLLKTVISGKVHPEQLVTHHFALQDVMQAYETFGNAMQEQALKVIIAND